MQKIIGVALVVVLIVSLTGVYLGISGPQKAEQGLRAAVEKINAEIQKISARVPAYVYTGEPVGFIVEFENGAKFYNTGDTGLMADMKLVIGDYYKPDVAFISMGGTFSMDAQAAAYAASMINPSKYIIPTHYKSYPFLAQSADEFVAALKKYNLKASPLVPEVAVEQKVMDVKTTWLGHNAWFFTSPNGVKILIDPAGTYNPSYPAQYKDPSTFGGVDLILLTHGHADHATVSDLKKIVDAYHPLIIAPMELGMWLQGYLNTPIMNANKGANISANEMRNMGIPEDLIKRIGNIKINLVSASHSSSAVVEQ